MKCVAYCAFCQISTRHSIDHFKPDFVRQHLSHSVKIMGIEAVDIGGKAQALRLREDGDRALFRCIGKFTEADPAAVQCRLYSWKGSLHDLADFLERISQDIL